MCVFKISDVQMCFSIDYPVIGLIKLTIKTQKNVINMTRKRALFKLIKPYM